LTEEEDEESAYEVLPDEPVSVVYNPKVPPETFRRGDRGRVPPLDLRALAAGLDYFDAFTIGLTATPNKQAFGFFKQNLVMEYGHEAAVADAVNVDFDVYRIRTEITERGSTVDAGLVTGYRDRQTREVRWEQLDEEVTYRRQLDRAVVPRTRSAPCSRRSAALFTEIFPGRTTSEDADLRQGRLARRRHRPDRPRGVRQGRRLRRQDHLQATGEGGRADRVVPQLVQPAHRGDRRHDRHGTDVKPLECVFFMRAVKSRTYFEQMKGRGVRMIQPDDLQGVTPDAPAKDRFVIV
jgi:type I restriction enzyme R subunit